MQRNTDGYKNACQRKYQTGLKIDEHIIDKTKIKKVSALTWIWVDIIKPKDKEILSISMSKERNMFV